jgi:hypothetical protein
MEKSTERPVMTAVGARHKSVLATGISSAEDSCQQHNTEKIATDFFFEGLSAKKSSK